MKGKAIRAKIEKSGYRILKFLVAQPPNPIVSQSVCGESLYNLSDREFLVGVS
jgi:hypothetical protein